MDVLVEMFGEWFERTFTTLTWIFCIALEHVGILFRLLTMMLLEE